MKRKTLASEVCAVAALAFAANAGLWALPGATAAAKGPSDAEAWAAAQTSGSPDVLRDFIIKHRSSHFAVDARARLAQLEAAEPMPPPTSNPSRTLASILRFDGVARMGAPLTPTPLALAVVSQPAVSLQTAGALTPAPIPASAQVPTPAAAEPVAPVALNTAPPPPRADVAAIPGADNPLARPRMLEFDMPILPAAFCTQLDMYSYLSVFHTELDRAAKANNQTATQHLQTLSARFTALIGAQPGSADFLAVDTEMHAYQLEADNRFKTAQAVTGLDPKIRQVPVRQGDGCAHEPWPHPVHAASAPAAQG